MGLRLFILWLTLSFSLNVFSQGNSDNPNIDDIGREKSVAINKNWEVVTGLKKIHRKKFKGKNSEVYHQSKDSVFVKKKRDTTKPLLTLENEDEEQVVYNPKRKQFGAITGTLVINLNSLSDLKNILDEYPIKQIRLEKKLSLVIVKVKKGNDIEAVFSNLKKDTRIQNAEVEIISNRLNPL
ncbi:MAG: hypothetical protein WC635_05425 [Bacteriovorax sp.]|jgi:hypothetical protein